MKILTFGEIMEGGNSVFTVIAQQDNEDLEVKFKGVIKAHDPYKDLSHFVHDMEAKLKELKISHIKVDFTDLKYCNSTGFYVLMDILESIYTNTNATLTVRRLANDDWQQSTLPVLLNLGNKERNVRTTFVDEEEM